MTNKDGPKYSLATWAAQHVETPEALEQKRAIATALALEGINDGSILCLDGVGSPLSIAIQKQHGPALFEMNRDWVETAQDWTCPCCNRGKFDIARLGNKGQILAKLVEHHDHMSEALKAAFHRVFEVSGTENPTPTGLALVERIAPALSAFSPVLVCEDCNNADAAAKNIILYDVKWLSFYIGHIRQFIEVGQHAAHGIDEAKVRELWLLIRPAYKTRMQLVYSVAQAAVLHDHWYDALPPGMTEVPTLSNGLQHSNGLHLVSGEALCRAMADTHVKHPANRCRWRTANKPAGGSPPPNYLAMVQSQPGAASRWNPLDHGWVCPICDRTKYEILSYKDGKISFHTHLPSKKSRAWVETKDICAACYNVVRDVQRELQDSLSPVAGATFDCITPDQLRSIIRPRPHSAHAVDGKKAQQLIIQWQPPGCTAQE